MSTPAYHIKRHDTAIVIQYQVKQESDGLAKDLTGHTATFSLREKGAPAGTLEITNSAATISIPTSGFLDFAFPVVDASGSGKKEYEGAFEVTKTSGGNKFTVPNKGYIDIVIEDDINNT